jgi:hypothetical protein
MKEGNEIMQTTPVRIDNDVLSIVRAHKEATGLPMQRFIEDAIVEKIELLPMSVKEKMGLRKVKSKYVSSLGELLIKKSIKK